MFYTKVRFGFFFIFSVFCFDQSEIAHSQIPYIQDSLTITILENEYWWGGLSVDGMRMPYTDSLILSRDLNGDNRGNQAQPVLISSKGRYIWSEQPISYYFHYGQIKIFSSFSKIFFGQSGISIRDAFRHVSNEFFPANGKIPDSLLFAHPQYNTWIELMYNQNEDDILKYAQSIIKFGFPPGILIIDDNWQENYGIWKFSARRFKSPKKLIQKLHSLGFTVMLWVCPFISPDSDVFRYLAKEGMLLQESTGSAKESWHDTQNNVAIIRWWNGASALLDLSNPASRSWFTRQLKNLVDEYDIDGFKFDAGDARFYSGEIISLKPSLPNDHTMYYTSVGLEFPLNEFRASWKMAGLPLVQRLRDKRHNWGDLNQLIPGIIAQGLMGYAYTCPDMIGGGEHQSFLNLESLDQELIVRWAQCSALMPMMQFSVAPWRVLTEENMKMCRNMVLLHTQLSDDILNLAKEASETGEPIVRPLAYVWPSNGYELIKDQFMLGNDILVAPVLRRGERERKIVFPPGTWLGDDGTKVTGPITQVVKSSLDRLPWYRKIQ
jgi:alpha-glucosidase (family GH31 glycosyl hydrolase)